MGLLAAIGQFLTGIAEVAVLAFLHEDSLVAGFSQNDGFRTSRRDEVVRFEPVGPEGGHDLGIIAPGKLDLPLTGICTMYIFLYKLVQNRGEFCGACFL